MAARSDLPLRADADRSPGPHPVPANPQPLVLAPGDRRRGSQDARPVPPARRGGRPDGRLRLRRRVRAALSHRGVPERDRHRSRRRRPLRAVGRGLLQRLRRRSGRAGAHDRGPRGHSRVLGGRAGGPSWRARAPAGRPRLASPARDLRRPPAHRRRDARHADGARPRRAGHDACRARLHVRASRRPIPSTGGC